MYQIGQILYIVLNKKMVILPVQIIEETNTKKLINGKTENVIHYVVKTKETNGFKLLKLEEIDGEIFTNKNTLYETLTKRVNEQIKTMIETATQKSIEWFDVANDNTTLIETDNVLEENKQNENENQEKYQIVELEDGKLAKVKISFPKELL